MWKSPNRRCFQRHALGTMSINVLMALSPPPAPSCMVKEAKEKLSRKSRKVREQVRDEGSLLWVTRALSSPGEDAARKARRQARHFQSYHSIHIRQIRASVLQGLLVAWKFGI